MATVLGISTDHAATVAREVSGKRAIKGLSTHHLKLSLEKLGCNVYRYSTDKAAQPTVAQWLKANAHIFKDQHVVLVHGNHFGTLLGKRYLCSLTKKLSVPLADIPKRRARVEGYLVIRALPASTPEAPAAKSKVTITGAAARRKVLALAKTWDIDVSRDSPDQSIWIYPPHDMPEDLDPHNEENGGEGHFVDEWDEALERVQELVEAVKKWKAA